MGGICLWRGGRGLVCWRRAEVSIVPTRDLGFSLSDYRVRKISLWGSLHGTKAAVIEGKSPTLSKVGKTTKMFGAVTRGCRESYIDVHSRSLPSTNFSSKSLSFISVFKPSGYSPHLGVSTIMRSPNAANTISRVIPFEI